MRLARALITFVAAAACLLPAAAQTIVHRPWMLSQSQRKVWQIEDGLPSNYVTAVTQAPSGKLLVGTKSGIVAFDGFHFTTVAALRDVWVTCLLQATDGTLWAGTHDQGLFRIRDDHATRVSDGAFFSLTQSGDGRIVAVSGSGAGFVDSHGFSVAIPGAITDAYGWQSATFTPDGALWFAASSSLFRSLNGALSPVHIIGSEGVPVTIDATGTELYLGTTTGLFRLSCTASDCRAARVANVLGPVVGIRRAYDQTLWISTWGNGIFRLSQLDGQDRVETMNSRDGLADDFVRSSYEDNEHNMWVGTRGGGLTRFRKTVLRPFGIAEGMDGNCASSAIGDGQGGVWLGTWRSGLFHWTNGRMVSQPLPADRLGILITTLALDNANNLWFGSFNGFWVLRQGSATPQYFHPHVDHPHDDTNSDDKTSIRQLFFARDGSLWVLETNGGLSVYPSGDPATSGPHAVAPAQHFTYIAQDEFQNIWLGASNGLWRYSAASGSATPALQSASPVLSISEDRSHHLWTTFEDGTIRVGSGAAASFAPFSSAGLPNKLIYKVMQDPTGNYWFSTGLGLGWVTAADVNTALQNPAFTAVAVHMGTAEGARTIECRCAQYPQAWAAPDGVMWIPTSKGFVQADPRRIGPRLGPRASIDTIRWDSVPPVTASNATLPAGAPSIEIQFSAVSLGSADEVAFRYRLDGLDDRWVDAGNNGYARYAQIPPGRHRFLVQARDAMGDWGPAAEAILLQKPRLYQTLWFRLLIVALFPLLMYGIYMLRTRSLQNRYDAILQERGRIAREWHDTLLAGLAAISWQLDGAARDCSDQTLLRTLNDARSMLRYCSQEARMAVEGLRNQSVETGSMAAALEETLRQVTLGTQVRFDVKVDTAVPDLSGEVRQALTRICQEAATNAIRHGKPSRLSVSLSLEDATVILCVDDDGVGMNRAFLETSPPGHFGILGMKERMQRIGGELKITTIPLKGTTVTAMVPMVL